MRVRYYSIVIFNIDQLTSRRSAISTFTLSMLTTTLSQTTLPNVARADGDIVMDYPVQVVVKGDVKKLFDEARVLEQQGNMAAANRIYTKVTKMAPRVRL